MRLSVDPKSDALRLSLDDSQIIEREVVPGIILDFNAANEVVGIEVLRLSRRSPTINLKELQFQTA